MAEDSDFLRQLRATFMVEAREHAETMSRGLLQMEQQTAAPASARDATLESVFRAAHSLKGAARAVEMPAIESICQLLEEVFASMRRGTLQLQSGMLDVMLRALDAIEVLVESIDGNAPAKGQPDLALLRRQLRQLATRTAGEAKPGTPEFRATPVVAYAAPATDENTSPAAVHDSAAADPDAAEATHVHTQPAGVAASASATTSSVASAVEETVRVPVASLELQLLETEELLVAKLAASERVASLREVGQWFGEWRKAWIAVERNASALRQTDNAQTGQLLAFIDWSNDAVRALENRMVDARRTARQEQELIGKSVDALLESAKRLLLFPFSTLSASLPRMVRDLARAEGKEADLIVTGEQTQVDKLILEEIKDPLLHMLRNAVDHAVEKPADRVAAGKSSRATIRLAISRGEGQRVHIVLSDDGRGIDGERVRRVAIERGVVSAEQAASLDEAGVLALVFRSDLSTGESVTQLSGRGLGLAIAHEHTRRLGGELKVQSKLGQGTTFEIVLPAVRATFRGVLCEAAGHMLLLPVNSIEMVGRVKQSDIRSVEGRQTVVLDGKAVALVRLADVLGLASSVEVDATNALQIVLASSGDDAIAFAVDAVIEEQEVLLKPLRKPLVRVRNVAAAAVLGSGRIVPILNVADLLKSARGVRAIGAQAPDGVAPMRAAPVKRSVLVAEDSITSRMLLKTILEAEGYRVTTAVDGMEAFALLRSEPFDLLVSDVEMPRLDGFELTARVRADKKLAALPIVLVTALARREDRERGIDAGANAYIVKGSFDQNNLVESVRRLI